MILIVCVDDKLGMSFGQRRQSRDKWLTKHIIEKVGDARAWVTDYTAKMLFNGEDNNRPSNWMLSEIPHRAAAQGEFCFAEALSATEIQKAMDSGSIEAIWMYFWNRVYPNDNRFPLDMDTPQWSKISENEIEGYSHPIMMEVIYERNR